MRSAGSTVEVVAGLALFVLALAHGYVGVPLLRKPRRPGESWRISLQMRHRWKTADRIPDWVTLAVLGLGGLGWLLSRYG